MYFKRIELNGFKSFADPVTIEFTEGITCIVGPNGSGKSNVSDAIRWVLGEQSPKTLRGGKMEEVIFAGTQNRKPKGMAEVTLVIDNSNHSLPIDFAEVGITRRMYRSGESEYMINHTPCRLRDIRELIMDTGIGVEGYSIIGQGKISDIIDNKMDSRREIFEEAAGVTKYRARKADAEKKLSSASLNLDRVNDIVGEIEGRIDGLREESEKATEYLDVKAKYEEVEVNIILRNIEAAEEKSRAVLEEQAELAKAVEEAQTLRDELDERLREERVLGEELETKLNSGRDTLLRLTEEMHTISSTRELNNERRQALEKEKMRLQDELLAIDDKLAREGTNNDQLQQAKTEAQEALAAARKALEEKSAAFEAAIEAENKAVEVSEELKESIFDISGRITEINGEIASVDGLKTALQARKQRLIDDESSTEEGDAILAKRLEVMSAKKDSLSDAQKKVKEELVSAKTAERMAILHEADAASTLGELKITEGRLAARAKLLEELESSYEGYNNGVRFIMKQNLPGLVGAVGELISVPKGWETAIETELGNKMQNIVCKKDSDARKAIELLKNNRAGRLTFLPVENLRIQPTPDPSDLQGCKGFLGLASDRVKCKGYDDVVDYLLGRVIVVDNIDNAIAMSRNNDGPFRFVTLDGEIINAAGAITGGSLRNNTGNILSRKSEQGEIRAQMKKAEEDVEKQEAARAAAADAIEKARAGIAELQEQSRKLDMDLALADSELSQIRNLQMASKEAGDKRSLELAELEKQICGIDAGTAENRRKIEELEAQKKQAEENSAAAADALARARVAYEDARTGETEAQLAEASAQERLKGTAELAQRAAAVVYELKAEKRSRQFSFDETIKAIESMDDSGSKADEILQAKTEQKTALEEELKNLTEQRRQIMAKAEATDKERSEKERELYEKQIKKHDADSRMSRFESQTESLKEKLWDEFELSYAQAADREVDDFVMSRALRESREYKERLRRLGDVNIGSIEEYKTVSERYTFLTAQRADIMQAMDELRKVIEDMDVTIRRQYKESFDKVVSNFEAIFSELFGGGHARLTMEDPDNPLESGVEIEAQPPGKKLQNMNLLSGGEKTMTAIALMFAVLKAKPTPFCILDEVEAALDDANIDRFADYLKNFSETQFALVTHQKVTMEHAASLYGVTMPEQGVSRILSLKLEDRPEI